MPGPHGSSAHLLAVSNCLTRRRKSRKRFGVHSLFRTCTLVCNSRVRSDTRHDGTQ